MMKYFTEFIIAVLIMILIMFSSTVFGFRKLMASICWFATFFCFIFLAFVAVYPDLRSLEYEPRTFYHAVLIMMGSIVFLWFFDKTK